jgi:hypothetical protein
MVMTPTGVRSEVRELPDDAFGFWCILIQKDGETDGFRSAALLGYAKAQADHFHAMLGGGRVTLWGPDPGGSSNPFNDLVYEIGSI